MEHIINQVNSYKGHDLQKNFSKIILNASLEINEPDLPQINLEFADYYQNYLNQKIFPACLFFDHSTSLENDNKESENKIPRVVVIGDIHSDFNVISTILLKLAISEYNYFDDAIFIFLGDYIDRGMQPLQTLRLIYSLKAYLGARCVLLRGNHDLVTYKDSKLVSEVNPADTVKEIMNPYLSPEVNKLFADYCSRLPVMVSLNQGGKKFLLCHGGIPKDEAFPLFDIDKLKVINLPCENSVFTVMFKQMLWGDPAEMDRKLQGSESRFEFGYLQFKEFMDKNNFDFLIRGHEPVINGIKMFYDMKLITVFSSGGTNNSHSYYSSDVPSPAFAIIMEDGSISFENVFEFGVKSITPIQQSDKDLLRFTQITESSAIASQSELKKLST